MPKTIDDLLNERGHAESVVKSSTQEIVKKVEDYILSVIYIHGKLVGAGGGMTSQETIMNGVRNLYDSRFQESDILAGLKNLATYQRVIEHKKTNSAPSDYSIPGKQQVNLIPIQFKEGF